MADFCLQCNLDLYFGPHSDFDHYGKAGTITEGDVAKGLGIPVICEGCGFVRVDHLGRCLGDEGCLSKHTPPGLSEVLRSVSAWQARRSGPLGRLYRLRDRFLGTPWEPGEIHFPGHPLWYVREFFRALYEGRPMQRVVDGLYGPVVEDCGPSIIFMEGFDAYTSEGSAGKEPPAVGAWPAEKDDHKPPQAGMVRDQDL